MSKFISIAIAALLLVGCESWQDEGGYCDRSEWKPAWSNIFTILVGPYIDDAVCSIDAREKKTPTDLSSVKEGAKRTDIEKALGSPLRTKRLSADEATPSRTLAVYRFNRVYSRYLLAIVYGREGRADYIVYDPYKSPDLLKGMTREEIGVFFGPPVEMFDISALDPKSHHSIGFYRKDSEDPGYVIVFGAGGRQVRFKEAEAPGDGPNELRPTREDLQFWAATPRKDNPASASDRFGLLPTKQQQDYWLCLNAQHRNPWVLREMGRRYWRGKNVAHQDKVLGYMYYSLAAKADPADAGNQDERRRSLSPAQLRKAQLLAAGWKPDEKSCDALPGS